VNNLCVLVVTKDSLLSIALFKLVDISENKFDVVESNANDIDEFIEEISTTKAHVILLERNGFIAEGDILEKILSMHPDLLVIITNQEDNWIRTYRRRDILIGSSADLIKVILSAQNTRPYKNKTKEKESV